MDNVPTVALHEMITIRLPYRIPARLKLLAWIGLLSIMLLCLSDGCVVVALGETGLPKHYDKEARLIEEQDVHMAIRPMT